MTSRSKSEAENIAKGDEIMLDYIIEAKKVMESDILKDDYDYIADVAMSSRINGYDEGKEVGREEGAENKSLEIAKEMKKQGYSLKEICSIIKVPIDKLTSWLL